jgi:hypothetical protein
MRLTSTLLLFLLTFLASNSHAYNTHSGELIYNIDVNPQSPLQDTHRYPMWGGYNSADSTEWNAFKSARHSKNTAIVHCYAKLNDLVYSPTSRYGSVRQCTHNKNNDGRLDMPSWSYTTTFDDTDNTRLDVYVRSRRFADEPGRGNDFWSERREIAFILRGTVPEFDNYFKDATEDIKASVMSHRKLTELRTNKIASFANGNLEVGFSRNARYFDVEPDSTVRRGWDNYFQNTSSGTITVEAGIMRILEEAEQWLQITGTRPDFRSLGIKVSGHSLGGASSQLLGLLLHKRYYDLAKTDRVYDGVDVEVIAFDPPALGNHEMSNALTRLSATVPTFDVHVFANPSDTVYRGLDTQTFEYAKAPYWTFVDVSGDAWANSTTASDAEYYAKKTYTPLFLRSFRAANADLPYGTIGMENPLDEGYWPLKKTDDDLSNNSGMAGANHSYYKWSWPNDHFAAETLPENLMHLAALAPWEVTTSWFPILPIGDRTARPRSMLEHIKPKGYIDLNNGYRRLPENIDLFSSGTSYEPGQNLPVGAVQFGEDGNLRFLGGNAWWGSGTADQGATELNFTGSGRLEIRSENAVLWKSPAVSGATSIHYSEAEEALYWIGYDGARLAVIRPEFDDGFVELDPSSPLTFVSASQKDIIGRHGAEKAIDGNIDGSSFTHTKTSSHTWWQGDFGKPKTVHTITLNNRSTCCTERLQNFYIFITDVDVSGKTFAEIQDSALFSRFIDTPVSSDQNTSHYTSYDIGNGVQGRYVLIYKAGDGYLSLAEVEAEGRSFHQTNEEPELLTFKSALQKDTIKDRHRADIAIDGNIDGNLFTHTKTSSHTWWQGDFGKDVKLSEVSLFNRINCCAGRLDDFYMFVTNESVVGKSLEEIKAMASHEVYFSNPVPSSSSSNNSVSHTFTAYRDNDNATRLNSEAVGRYLVIYKKSKSYLSLAEVQVKGYYYE